MTYLMPQDDSVISASETILPPDIMNKIWELLPSKILLKLTSVDYHGVCQMILERKDDENQAAQRLLLESWMLTDNDALVEQKKDLLSKFIPEKPSFLLRFQLLCIQNQGAYNFLPSRLWHSLQKQFALFKKDPSQTSQLLGALAPLLSTNQVESLFSSLIIQLNLNEQSTNDQVTESLICLAKRFSKQQLSVLHKTLSERIAQLPQSPVIEAKYDENGASKWTFRSDNRHIVRIINQISTFLPAEELKKFTRLSLSLLTATISEILPSIKALIPLMTGEELLETLTQATKTAYTGHMSTEDLLALVQLIKEQKSFTEAMKQRFIKEIIETSLINANQSKKCILFGVLSIFTPLSNEQMDTLLPIMISFISTQENSSYLIAQCSFFLTQMLSQHRDKIAPIKRSLEANLENTANCLGSILVLARLHAEKHIILDARCLEQLAAKLKQLSNQHDLLVSIQVYKWLNMPISSKIRKSGMSWTLAQSVLKSRTGNGFQDLNQVPLDLFKQKDLKFLFIDAHFNIDYLFDHKHLDISRFLKLLLNYFDKETLDNLYAWMKDKLTHATDATDVPRVRAMSLILPRCESLDMGFISILFEKLKLNDKHLRISILQMLSAIYSRLPIIWQDKLMFAFTHQLPEYLNPCLERLLNQLEELMPVLSECHKQSILQNLRNELVTAKTQNDEYRIAILQKFLLPYTDCVQDFDSSYINKLLTSPIHSQRTQGKKIALRLIPALSKEQCLSLATFSDHKMETSIEQLEVFTAILDEDKLKIHDFIFPKNATLQRAFFHHYHRLKQRQALINQPNEQLRELISQSPLTIPKSKLFSFYRGAWKQDKSFLENTVSILNKYTLNHSSFLQALSNRHYIPEVDEILQLINTGKLTTIEQLYTELAVIAVENKNGHFSWARAFIFEQMKVHFNSIASPTSDPLIYYPR